MAWLLSPQQTTPAPGQKCAAEYLGQHQPALQHLQHCSTAAVDTCCSAYQMSTIFSGMEAVVASSGQHKGGDCSTAALQADPVTAPGRAALHIPFHRSGKKLQQQPAALQLIVWTLQRCSSGCQRNFVKCSQYF